MIRKSAHKDTENPGGTWVNPDIKTGWPPPALMQDDSAELSKALSKTPDAKLHAREAAKTLADYIKQVKEDEGTLP
jgi:hypothetical protein